MNPGRNEPCPCGSGKKYKKCCLARDEAAPLATATTAVSAAEEKGQAEEADRDAELEPQQQEWEIQRRPEPTDDAELVPKSTPREPDWPPLSESDQQWVDAWWKEVGPVYTGRRDREKCGWLVARTLAFLEQQPRLFRYLYLHEEFLFELGGALARAGRTEDYLALLRRLRAEQPEMYFQCFGYYDEDLVTEALRTGRREEIPPYLDLFRQHPVKHIDQFAKMVNLLAWRGYEAELRALLEPTAQIIAHSREVIGGNFGLEWLTNLAIFPFLEAGDDSGAALDNLLRSASAVGYLDPSEGNRAWLSRAVRMASRSTTEAPLDLKATANERLYHDAGWNFAGWAHRTKGLAWTSARYLANALSDYWDWREERKKPTSPFGLNETRLDHYLAQCCRSFIGLDGGRALPTLQAFHYFTQYLVAHDYFSAADAARLQKAAAGFYEHIRGGVDSCDSAYRICPTYDALIALPSSS